MQPSFDVFTGPEHQPFLLEGGEPAALLVHGFPGTPAEMRPLAAVLHDAGWTVRGLLLPGFGPEIAALGDKSAEDWRAAIDAALAELRQTHRPLIVGGHSMGGALAIGAAAAARTDGLILSAPFWRVDSTFWNTIWPLINALLPGIRPFRIVNLDFDHPEVREGIRKWMPGADLDDPAVREAIRSFAIPTRLLNEIRSAGQAAYRVMPQVRAPIFAVQGTRDPIVKPRRTRQLLARASTPVSLLEVTAEHNLLDASAPYWPTVAKGVRGFLAQVEAR